MRPQITRREATRLLVTIGISSAVVMMLPACADDGAFSIEASWLLRGLSSDDLLAVGDAYRRTFATEQSVTALRTAVAQSMREARRWPWSAAPSPEDVVAAEFARGAVVVVDGWVLSRTEARLCALLAANTGRATSLTRPG